MAQPAKTRKPGTENRKTLRRGWTTGACAAAAAKACYCALHTGQFPDIIAISLPKGENPHFKPVHPLLTKDHAECGIIKDAGDDPDVTHGLEIRTSLKRGKKGTGVLFQAGDGVGVVTKPGLPLAVGEAAINPAPREIIIQNISDALKICGGSLDLVITISIPGGRDVAEKTWNPRLGIVGGLSILGTTGIVHPYSCSAWIHSIHRGIDVACASGLTHIVGSTGTRSEAAARHTLKLSDHAWIDMGDFVGGMLKYARKKPIDSITISGGFAKMVKLAQGAMDLHSARSQVDFNLLAKMAGSLGAAPPLKQSITTANTAAEVLSLCHQDKIPIETLIAVRARETALAYHGGANIHVIVVDRAGHILAYSSDMKDLQKSGKVTPHTDFHSHQKLP